LAFDQQSCVLFSREGERFGNNAGPAFLPGESPKISCLVKNIGDTEMEVSPNILWKEVFVYSKPLEGKIAEEKQDQKIFFKPGESKTVSLFMPIAEKPQTYQGLLSFEDEKGESRSFNYSFRWTIAGESARIKSVAQTSKLKDFYDKGDTVALSVDYFGSSDLYWAGTQDVSNLSDLTMKTVIKDNGGNACGEKEEILADITDGFSKNKTVEVVLDKKCKGMTYAVSLSSGQKGLAEQSGDLPKIVNRQNVLQYLYFGLPAFLILLAFYFFVRKKSVPVYFFTILFFAVAILSGTALASITKIYPTSGGTAKGIEWGGEWVNDADNNKAGILFSTADGTGGVNWLKPLSITAQLAGFFVDNTNIGKVDINYYTDDTSCSNTAMEVEYEVLITAEGLNEVSLTTKRLEYNDGYRDKMDTVEIPSGNIQSLYDESGIPRKNPKLIVKMKQIGMYGANEEFLYSYEWVGTREDYVPLGDYEYYYEGDYYSYVGPNKGTFVQVKTANENFYPGLFTSDQSAKMSKADAYAKRDTMRIEIDLLLPSPTLRIEPLVVIRNPGETKKFKVFYDADGPDNASFEEKEITSEISVDDKNNWSSDNPEVATVKETGEVTAVVGGSAKVKAVYYRGLSAKTQIYVPTLSIKPSKALMAVGEIKQFDAWYDEDGFGKDFAEKLVNDKASWLSNSALIATVGNKGKVKAVDEGRTHITARYWGLEGKAMVTVYPVGELSVSCVSDKESAIIGENITFTVLESEPSAVYSYLWTGDEGLSGTTKEVVKAYSTVGIKNATIKIQGGVGAVATDTCSVTITEPPIHYSYKISPISNSAEVKKSVLFEGWFNGQRVTDLATWGTSNANVATIKSIGFDIGRGEATCIGEVNDDTLVYIYSTTTQDGIEYSDTAELTCKPGPVIQRDLTVKVIGQGSVSGGIDSSKDISSSCGSDCLQFTKTYANGVGTWLTAKADTGWKFLKWETACPDATGPDHLDSDGNPTCDPIIMDETKIVTVVFEAEPTYPTYRIDPISATRDIGDSVQFDGYYDSDGMGTTGEVKIENSKASWSAEDNNEGDDIFATISAGLATCKKEDNAGVNILSTYLNIDATASLYCEDGVYGDCDTSNNSCLVGGLVDTTDSDSQYLWQCEGTKSTASCSLDKSVPTASISANLSFAETGDTATIEWESTNAVSCKPTLGDVNWKNTARGNYSATSDSNQENFEPETYDTDAFASLPITFTITCTSVDGKTATDSVTIAKKIPPPDPSYNISPDHKELEVGNTWQFTGIFDPDNGSDPIDVTNLADWESDFPSVVSITTTGTSGRGKATCHSVTVADNPITITSTYKYENIPYTDTATVACTQTDPPDRTLTVNIIGKGKTDGLVNCENLTSDKKTCVNTFDNDDSGYLRATPGTGWKFGLSGWSNACSLTKENVFTSDGTDDYSTDDFVCDPLTMTANKEVTVVFEADPTYEIDPQEIKIKINEKTQFKGLYDPDGIGESQYPQDKADIADWKVLDLSGNIDDSIAVFNSVGLKKGEAKCISEGTAYIYSSYDGKDDFAELICSTEPTVYYTLTVKKSENNTGYGEITGAVECDANCDSASADYPAGTKVEITATPIPKDGSDFGGWLLSDDCASFGKNGDCELTMISDKTATALFDEKPTPLPIAYISAEDTSVAVGGTTIIRWKSDNATSCIGDGGDEGWLDDNDWTANGISGEYTTISFAEDEERDYAVTCSNNSDDSSASVVVSAGAGNEPPTVDLWADPDEVEFGETAMLSWVSSNTKYCSIDSDKDKSFVNLAPNDETETSTLDQELTDYSYTITCVGDDGSTAKDEVIIKTGAKPCPDNNCVGTITITASDIEATIVAGLTTNSKKNDNLEKVKVSSNDCKDSMFDFSFKYDNSGPGDAYWGSNKFNLTGQLLGEEILVIKNIKGDTLAEKYSITLRAECKDATDGDNKGKTIFAEETIYLTVKRILSDWLEF